MRIVDGRIRTAHILDANVTLAKLPDGVLTADAAGRLKVADGFVNNAKVDAAAAIALTKMATNLTNVILGIGAEYRVARDTRAMGAASEEFATGLTTVVAATATLREDPALTGYWVTALESATPGSIILKIWKPTGAADVSPLASTTFGDVDWVAVGT
ncbi:MAG: hypothetical protein Q8O40_13045 [Chloroflexota bacterium]|nr:hypothetical protein [Chloroflexota bacterium]